MPGQDSFNLPTTLLPMFTDNLQDISFEVRAFRSGGPVFDFDAFFNENVGANITGLLSLDNSSCESSSEITVDIDPIP